MTDGGMWAGSSLARQRLLTIVALVAIVAAWRERSFARNRARYGSPMAGRGG